MLWLRKNITNGRQSIYPTVPVRLYPYLSKEEEEHYHRRGSIRIINKKNCIHIVRRANCLFCFNQSLFCSQLPISRWRWWLDTIDLIRVSFVPTVPIRLYPYLSKEEEEHCMQSGESETENSSKSKTIHCIYLTDRNRVERRERLHKETLYSNCIYLTDRNMLERREREIALDILDLFN